MVPPAHDFGGHVAGCAAGVVGVVVADLPGDPEVRQPDVPVGLENEVLGFYVAVDYFICVQVLQGD